MTKKKVRPQLNQDCRGELGAIICGENCPICYWYDCDGEREDWYYSYYFESDDTRETKPGNVISQHPLDLTDTKEWPRLPSPCGDELVEIGIAIFEEHYLLEQFWHEVTKEEGASCDEWDIVSEVGSVRSYASDMLSSTSYREALVSCKANSKESKLEPPSKNVNISPKTAMQTRFKYQNESTDGDVLYSIYEGVKSSRGGKERYRFNKENKRRPRGCYGRCWSTPGPSCRSCRNGMKGENTPAINQKKKELKRFCTEVIT